jgi:hypothetical protein
VYNIQRDSLTSSPKFHQKTALTTLCIPLHLVFRRRYMVNAIKWGSCGSGVSQNRKVQLQKLKHRNWCQCVWHLEKSFWGQLHGVLGIKQCLQMACNVTVLSHLLILSTLLEYLKWCRLCARDKRYFPYLSSCSQSSGGHKQGNPMKRYWGKHSVQLETEDIPV